MTQAPCPDCHSIHHYQEPCDVQPWVARALAAEEEGRCGVLAYTLPPAPDRPIGIEARCYLERGHPGFHRPAERPVPPASEVRG